MQYLFNAYNEAHIQAWTEKEKVVSLHLQEAAFLRRHTSSLTPDNFPVFA